MGWGRICEALIQAGMPDFLLAELDMVNQGHTDLLYMGAVRFMHWMKPCCRSLALKTSAAYSMPRSAWPAD